MNEYLITEQVLDLLGGLGISMSRPSLYRHIKESGLPARKIGRAYYYKRDSVLAWLEMAKK